MLPVMTTALSGTKIGAPSFFTRAPLESVEISSFARITHDFNYIITDSFYLVLTELQEYALKSPSILDYIQSFQRNDSCD